MTTASDAIVAALLGRDAPDGEWTSSALRRVVGQSSRAFAESVQQLRGDGWMVGDRLALTAKAVAAEPAVAATAPTMAEQVAAEVRDASNRHLAARRSTVSIAVRGTESPLSGPSLGAQLQELALRDDPLGAASILRTRWNDLWLQICRQAALQGQKPLTAMVELLEGAVDAERSERAEISSCG